MSFGYQGLKNAGGSVASLVGQDIVARSISLTATSGNNAVSLVLGARMFLGANYLSEAGGVITWSGNNGLSAVQYTATGNTPLTGTNAGENFLYANNAAGRISLSTNITSANAGATPSTSHVNVYPQNALDAGDWVFNVATAANAASRFAVTYGGSIVLPTTDSSGTPGNATIDQATGRSAIAAAASTCVITNSLVTAASHVFISPRTRDATGLLPLATTIGAGSFTVSTTAACTANLVFDWLVIT